MDWRSQGIRRIKTVARRHGAPSYFNARPEASAVYGAMDMPWAKLVGQISHAYGK